MSFFLFGAQCLEKNKQATRSLPIWSYMQYSVKNFTRKKNPVAHRVCLMIVKNSTRDVENLKPTPRPSTSSKQQESMQSKVPTTRRPRRNKTERNKEEKEIGDLTRLAKFMPPFSLSRFLIK